MTKVTRTGLLWLAWVGLVVCAAAWMSRGRLLSNSVDLSYHVQVLEAVRPHLVVPESHRTYMAEMFLYPKLSHQLAAGLTRLGFGEVAALVVTAAAAAGLAWLGLFALVRKLGLSALALSAVLTALLAHQLGAVFGFEIVRNFFFPQAVGQGFAILALVALTALPATRPLLFATLAPLSVWACGWLHLVPTLQLAGALGIIAVLNAQPRPSDVAPAGRVLIALPLLAAALLFNPSFQVMRWLAVNNGSVNFSAELDTNLLILAAVGLLALCATALLRQVLRGRGHPREPRSQAAETLLAFGVAVAGAALAQALAWIIFQEGSPYAIRKHGFALFSAWPVALPAALFAWRPWPADSVLPARLAAPGVMMAVVAVMSIVLVRPNLLEADRVERIVEDVRGLRPAGEAGGLEWAFVSSLDPPVVSYLGTIALLRSERGPDAMALLTSGAPVSPEAITHLVTTAGDPVYDRPSCRTGQARGHVVVVRGACVAAPRHWLRLGGDGLDALGEGWSAAEPGGVWSLGQTASLSIPVTAPSGRAPPDRLQLSTFGFVPPESPQREVRIVLEDGVAQSFTFDRTAALTRLFVLPLSQTVLADGRIDLVIEIVNPVTPQSLRLGSDPRALGVGIEWYRLTSGSPH